MSMLRMGSKPRPMPSSLKRHQEVAKRRGCGGWRPADGASSSWGASDTPFSGASCYSIRRAPVRESMLSVSPDICCEPTAAETAQGQKVLQHGLGVPPTPQSTCTVLHNQAAPAILRRIDWTRNLCFRLSRLHPSRRIRSPQSAKPTCILPPTLHSKTPQQSLKPANRRRRYWKGKKNREICHASHFGSRSCASAPSARMATDGRPVGYDAYRL